MKIRTSDETRPENVNVLSYIKFDYYDMLPKKKKFNWNKFWFNFIILGAGIAWTAFNLLTLELK